MTLVYSAANPVFVGSIDPAVTMAAYDTLIVMLGGSIVNYSDFSLAIKSGGSGDFGTATINIYGQVIGSISCFNPMTLLTGVSGSIDGDIYSPYAVITNYGYITGGLMCATADIVNYGYMGGIRVTGNSDSKVVNHGEIASDVYFGNGNDLFDGTDGGNVTVRMGSGADICIGSQFGDRFSGQDGDDTIQGLGGNDTFESYSALVPVGSDGDDDYDGGAGNDTYLTFYQSFRIVVDLAAGTATGKGIGSDTLVNIENIVGSIANDAISGDNARNRLSGSGGNDTLNGSGGNDTLTGDAGRDTLDGGTGNDRLDGGNDRDVIIGGTGNDRITGGFDIDVMTGGTGGDVFDFNDPEETFQITTGPAFDTITDFTSGEDQIDLSTIDTDSATTGDQAFTFIGTAAFTAVGQVRYEQVGANTFVTASLYSPTGPTIEIMLTGLKVLTATDFVL